MKDKAESMPFIMLANKSCTFAETKTKQSSEYKNIQQHVNIQQIKNMEGQPNTMQMECQPNLFSQYFKRFLNVLFYNLVY